MSSSVSLPGTDGTQHCRCILQSRDRKVPGRAEGTESQETVYIDSKPPPETSCLSASSPGTLLAWLWPLTSHVHQLGRHQSLMLLPRA